MKIFLVWLFAVFGVLSHAQVLPQGTRNILTYSSFLGGQFDDFPHAMTVDAQGNVYIVGETNSPDFPVTSGALQRVHAGVPGGSTSFITGGPMPDAFITKLDVSGKIVYSTYLGGASSDVGWAVAADAEGNAYIAGTTLSPNFPVTTGAFQTSAAGSSAFVAKLNPSGSALVYSTLLSGSSGFVSVAGMRVDSAGNVYVTGSTTAPDFPVTSGAFQATAARGSIQAITHGFVSVLNATGGKLIYSTFLSGSQGSQPSAIALTSTGEALVAGVTQSADFPVTAGAYLTNFSGPQSRFVTRLNKAGSALVYSTFLAGSNNTTFTGIDVDATGAAYVTGDTYTAFPVTPGAFVSPTPPSPASPGIFVAKLDPRGSRLIYGALIVGDHGAFPGPVVVDAKGNAYITGSTTSTNFPVTGNAYQSGYSAALCYTALPVPFGGQGEVPNCGDVFVAELDPTGSTLVYSTYFGSNGTDNGGAIALAPDGSVYVGGRTNSAVLPATATAPQTHRSLGIDCSFAGSPSAFGQFVCWDAFVARFNPAAPAAVAPFEIVNSASFLPGAIVPGELVALFGLDIGPQQSASYQLNAGNRVTTSLSGVRVLFDSTPAPLLYVSANQINAVVPYDTAAKAQVQVSIENNGLSGRAQTIQIAGVTPGYVAVAPGIFSATASGAGQAAAFNQDGSINGPAHPAPAGSTVSVYATGLGVTNVTVPDGQITDPSLPQVNQGKVELFIDGRATDASYAGNAPFSVAGVSQVNLVVPPGTSSGAVPLFVSSGHTVSSQSGIWITVQ